MMVARIKRVRSTHFLITLKDKYKYMFNYPVLVAAGIIKRQPGSDTQVLITRRFPGDKQAAGLWEFPGGKVEYMEHPECALLREIKEELNIDVEIETFFKLSSYVYDTDGGKVHIVLLAYLCRYKSGALENLGCADSAWIYPPEIRDYEFAPADVEIVEKIMEGI